MAQQEIQILLSDIHYHLSGIDSFLCFIAQYTKNRK